MKILKFFRAKNFFTKIKSKNEFSFNPSLNFISNVPLCNVFMEMLNVTKMKNSVGDWVTNRL